MARADQAARRRLWARVVGAWDDLPLRAKGLVVVVGPVLALVLTAVAVIVESTAGGNSTWSLALLAALTAGALGALGASVAFTSSLTRRIAHLEANADRLARDTALEPSVPADDEIGRAEATLTRAADLLDERRQDLEEARASLEHLVSAGPMVMVAGTLSTNLSDPTPLLVDYVSSNSARVMGHSPVGLLAEPGSFVELVHREDVDTVLDAARTAIGDARSQVHVEFRLRHLDGSWRWMEGMLRGHQSDPCRVLAYLVDITARRQAERARRQSDSRLDAFLDNSTALVSIKDPFGKYQFVNLALAEVLGVDRADVLGRSDADFWPAAAPRLRADDQKVLVAGEPLEVEEVLELPDGAHTFLTTKFPLLGETEVPVAIASIATDITELTRALDSVAARERVLSTVIAASPDVITILEEDGTIRTTSIAFERIFGQPTRAVVDSSLFDLIHPDDRERTRVGFERLRQDPDTHRVTLRFRGRRADGSWVTIESHAQLVVGDDGAHDGVVMVSRDITDQIALEAALRAAKEQAERASSAKSDFLSRVSHELRTPMNAMLGFAQLLELEELGEPASEYVEQISRAGDHLLALINEVLDIARIETGHVHLQLEELDAVAAAREVLDLAGPLAARAGVALRGPTPGPTRLAVVAEHQRLLQVLLNLVSNAVKYNHPDGWVDVAVVPDGPDRIRIEVRDSGPGLDPDQLDRLFVPFDRLGLEHSGIEGTGVGLALSRGLAEQMDGRLGVVSEPGHGSTFWIELPAADDRSSRPSPALTGGRP